MAAPVRMGITSALGTGKQFFPWIHIKDLCEIYIKAIEDSQMVGAYNAVSPDHKTNDEFTGILSQTLKKRSRFPNVPSLLISLIFGEMAVTVLKGNRVSADKILASGFNFQFPDLNKALNDIFS
jgi:NAD dependent epimerase/dehydratase family enzyme